MAGKEPQPPVRLGLHYKYRLFGGDGLGCKIALGQAAYLAALKQRHYGVIHHYHVLTGHDYLLLALYQPCTAWYGIFFFYGQHLAAYDRPELFLG